MPARRHPVQHHRHRLNHRLDPAPRQAPRNGVKGHTLKLQIADYLQVVQGARTPPCCAQKIQFWRGAH
jgi:hypothetical protein